MEDSKSLFKSVTFWSLVVGLFSQAAKKYGYTIDEGGLTNDLVGLAACVGVIFGRITATKAVHIVAPVKQFAAGVVLLAIAACATPITANKGTAGVAIPRDSTVGQDLLAAAYNLDNAMSIGALPADDPSAACIHGVLKQAGIELAPGEQEPASFVPKSEGVVSVGATAYIRAQQLRNLKGIEVPVDCKALIGTFVVDGLHDARKLALPMLLQ